MGRNLKHLCPAAPGEAREIIPYFLVERTDGSQSGWFVGIEFSGRTHLTLSRRAQSLRGEVGLNPNPGPFRTRLSARRHFRNSARLSWRHPGGPDAAANILRRWVREVLGNPETLERPALPAHGREQQLGQRHASRRRACAAHDRRLRRTWPGNVPHRCRLVSRRGRLVSRSEEVSSWASAPSPTMRTRTRPEIRHLGRLDASRHSTLNQARSTSAIPKCSDWLVSDLPPDWKPEEFKGQTIDIGVPAAQAYAQQEVNRIVNDYHLDMLEHDGYLVRRAASATIIRMRRPTREPVRSSSDAGFVFRSTVRTPPTSAITPFAPTTTSIPTCARSIRILLRDLQ